MNLDRRSHRLGLALQMGIWLCWLPVRLHRHSLTELLARPTPQTAPVDKPLSRQAERTVGVVVRLCRQRFFDLTYFPRPCLRRSLALYHVLTNLGYPAVIHFGVHKTGGELQGHSWITVQGKLVAEADPSAIYREVYSYSSSMKGMALQDLGEFDDSSCG